MDEQPSQQDLGSIKAFEVEARELTSKSNKKYQGNSQWKSKIAAKGLRKINSEVC